MVQLKLKQKNMPGGGYRRTFTNRSLLAFKGQLRKRLQNDLQVEQMVRLYLAVDVQYLLSEHHRFEASVYGCLAYHLGLQKHVGLMLGIIRASDAFIVSTETDSHGRPTWFTSPYLTRPTDPKGLLFQ